MDIIEEKILTEIGRLDIDILFIDLSGMPDVDEYIISNFQKVLNGIKMMGAKSVLTGLRPQLAKKIASLGMDNINHIVTKGTLQQALQDYILVEA